MSWTSTTITRTFTRLEVIKALGIVLPEDVGILDLTIDNTYMPDGTPAIFFAWGGEDVEDKAFPDG